MQNASFSIINYQFEKVNIDLSNHTPDNLSINFDTHGVFIKENSVFELTFSVSVFNKETEENHLHGEMVAYGLLILLTVDQQMDELQRWLPIYRELGWPTKLSQLGLTASHIPQIVEKATSVHDIDVSPYKITADMLTKAIQYMESLD